MSLISSACNLSIHWQQFNWPPWHVYQSNFWHTTCLLTHCTLNGIMTSYFLFELLLFACLAPGRFSDQWINLKIISTNVKRHKLISIIHFVFCLFGYSLIHLCGNELICMGFNFERYKPSQYCWQLASLRGTNEQLMLNDVWLFVGTHIVVLTLCLQGMANSEHAPAVTCPLRFLPLIVTFPRC